MENDTNGYLPPFSRSVTFSYADGIRHFDNADNDDDDDVCHDNDECLYGEGEGNGDGNYYYDIDGDIGAEEEKDCNYEQKVNDVERGATTTSTNEELLMPDIALERQVRVRWRNVNAFVTTFGAQERAHSGLAPFWRSFENAKKEDMRKVLADQSGDAMPGTVTGLMGPSGSGKTTLLTILGGRREVPLVEGEVEYRNVRSQSNINIIGANSRRLRKNSKRAKAVKRKTGFVTQHEVLCETLTVQETLIFTARLKLPRTISDDEKIRKAIVVMRKLGIAKLSNEIVGGANRRGLSGGERKRVSIAIELLTDPNVLFCDEPTSGLDSTTATQLISTLKDLALGGRTVITSIHQPSSRSYAMMDRIILLANGHCIFFGSNDYSLEYFASLGINIQLGTNTADFLLDVATGQSGMSVGSLIKKFQSIQAKRIRSHQKKPYLLKSDVEDLDDFDAHKVLTAVTITKTGALEGQKHRIARALSIFYGIQSPKEHKWPVSWLKQFMILTVRCFCQRRFDLWDWITVAHYILTAVLVGLVWFQIGQERPLTEENILDVAGYFFISLTFLGFTVLFSSIFTFPVEKEIMLKERKSGMYRLSSYYCATMITDVPLALLYPLLYVVISYWMAGLKKSADFVLFILVIFLDVLVAQSVGLDIGALFLNLQKAQVAAALFTFFNMVTTGFLVTDMPSWVNWIKYLSFFRYAYQILMTIQFSGTKYQCENPPPGQSQCSISQLKNLLDHDPNEWVVPQVLAMLGFLILYRVLGYLALLYRSPSPT